MAKRRCNVQRVLFFAEMNNGEQVVMNLEGKQCDDFVGIAWAPLKGGEHPWVELYKGKAALAGQEGKGDQQAEYLRRAQMVRDLPPYPGPKPYLCWPNPEPLLNPLKSVVPFGGRAPGLPGIPGARSKKR